MIFILNILLGVVAFLLVRWLVNLISDGQDKLAVIVGIIAGIVVFLANIGAEIIR